MRIKKLLFVALLSVVIISCDGFSSKKAYDSYSRLASEETETVEEPIKPKRTDGFYERLLEEFCQRYYKDCFDGRSYVFHSLILKDRNGSEPTRITGKHSYKGKFGKKYSDADFMATIEEDESGYFKITFSKESAPDLFHNETYYETGTRTIHYSE